MNESKILFFGCIAAFVVGIVGAKVVLDEPSPETKTEISKAEKIIPDEKTSNRQESDELGNISTNQVAPLATKVPATTQVIEESSGISRIDAGLIGFFAGQALNNHSQRNSDYSINHGYGYRNNDSYRDKNYYRKTTPQKPIIGTPNTYNIQKKEIAITKPIIQRVNPTQRNIGVVSAQKSVVFNKPAPKKSSFFGSWGSKKSSTTSKSSGKSWFSGKSKSSWGSSGSSFRSWRKR